MNIYIIYDFFFGNTEKISRIITNHLSEKHEVKMFKAGEIETGDLKDVDLLIIGSPTRAFEPTGTIGTWDYSTTNYLILAKIIEEITGNTWWYLIWI
ncbi:MAG: hypothetical protein PF518_12180 [Spirochaetaceae bacterium]|jgi:flavorubredoxin|nr:hypothetical protein [Spirochaetaceae bacterium]